MVLILSIPCIVFQIIKSVHGLSAAIVPHQLQSCNFVPHERGTVRISNQIFSSLQKTQNVGSIFFLFANQVFLFGNQILNCRVVVGKAFIFYRFSVDFLQNQQNLENIEQIKNIIFLTIFINLLKSEGQTQF